MMEAKNEILMLKDWDIDQIWMLLANMVNKFMKSNQIDIYGIRDGMTRQEIKKSLKSVIHCFNVEIDEFWANASNKLDEMLQELQVNTSSFRALLFCMLKRAKLFETCTTGKFIRFTFEQLYRFALKIPALEPYADILRYRKITGRTLLQIRNCLHLASILQRTPIVIGDYQRIMKFIEIIRGESALGTYTKHEQSESIPGLLETWEELTKINKDSVNGYFQDGGNAAAKLMQFGPEEVYTFATKVPGLKFHADTFKQRQISGQILLECGARYLEAAMKNETLIIADYQSIVNYIDVIKKEPQLDKDKISQTEYLPIKAVYDTWDELCKFNEMRFKLLSQHAPGYIKPPPTYYPPPNAYRYGQRGGSGQQGRNYGGYGGNQGYDRRGQQQDRSGTPPLYEIKSVTEWNTEDCIDWLGQIRESKVDLKVRYTPHFEHIKMTGPILLNMTAFTLSAICCIVDQTDLKVLVKAIDCIRDHVMHSKYIISIIDDIWTGGGQSASILYEAPQITQTKTRKRRGKRPKKSVEKGGIKRTSKPVPAATVTTTTSLSNPPITVHPCPRHIALEHRLLNDQEYENIADCFRQRVIGYIRMAGYIREGTWEFVPSALIKFIQLYFKLVENRGFASRPGILCHNDNLIQKTYRNYTEWIAVMFRGRIVVDQWRQIIWELQLKTAEAAAAIGMVVIAADEVGAYGGNGRGCTGMSSIRLWTDCVHGKEWLFDFENETLRFDREKPLKQNDKIRMIINSRRMVITLFLNNERVGNTSLIWEEIQLAALLYRRNSIIECTDFRLLK